MATTKTKTVEYSYPTSSNAKRFGFNDAGCWTVETCEGTKPPKAIAGYATRPEAIAHARRLALPWSPIFARLHPADAERGLYRVRCNAFGNAYSVEKHLRNTWFPVIRWLSNEGANAWDYRLRRAQMLAA